MKEAVLAGRFFFYVYVDDVWQRSAVAGLRTLLLFTRIRRQVRKTNERCFCVLVAVRCRCGFAHFFVKFRNELLSQFDHFARVFFVLNLMRQVAPIRGSGYM
jgi:hypothetical protein